MVDDGQRLPAIRNKLNSQEPKSALLKQNSKDEKEMMPFVTQYQPLVSTVKDALMEKWNHPLFPTRKENHFLWCHVINRETKFAFAIKALVILSVLYWQTKVK